MPEAWFSRKENKHYHVCLNCPYEDVFDMEYVEVRQESVILEQAEYQHLELCDVCQKLREDGECKETDDPIQVAEKFRYQRE